MYALNELLEAFSDVQHEVANDPEKPTMANQSRPGRHKLREKIKAGDDWHNNLIKLTASYVADSWPDEEILTQAQDLTNDGYTVEDTRKEMQKAIDGARAKGFDRPRQGTLALPVAEGWPRKYDAFDARAIPRRQWIYGRSYIRGHVSVVASAGGVGKTSLQVAEGLAIVTDRELLDETVHESCRVWLINLEDPMEEMQLRVTATMQGHGIVQEDVQGKLFLDAGRDFSMVFVEQGRDGIKVNEELVEAMIERIKVNEIGMIFVDPFVGCHAVNENDNMAMNAVVAQFRRIADETNAAIGLVHHTRKGNGQEETVDSVRGAGSVIGAARVARVVNRISTKDAANFQLSEEEMRSVFRVENAKANLSPPAENSVWRKLHGVQLANGEWVGVVHPYHPPALEELSVLDMATVQRSLEGLQVAPAFKEQAGNWAGYVAAEALKIDVGRNLKKEDRTHEQDVGRTKVRRLLKRMTEMQFLRQEEQHDGRNGRDRKVYVIGEAVPG